MQFVDLTVKVHCFMASLWSRDLAEIVKRYIGHSWRKYNVHMVFYLFISLNVQYYVSIMSWDITGTTKEYICPFIAKVCLQNILYDQA